MEELVLYSPLPVSTTVSFTPGTPINSVGPKVVGGFFQVTQDATLTIVGNSNLLHAPFNVVGTTISGNPSVVADFNDLYNYYGQSLKGAAAVELDGSGNVISTRVPLGTTIASVSPTALVLSNNSSASASVNLFIGGAYQQTFQIWQMTPTPTLLGSKVVLAGLEKTTKLNTALDLVPGVTYAVVTVVAGNEIPYTDAREVSGFNSAVVKLGNSILDTPASPISGFSVFGTSTGGSTTLTFAGDHRGQISVGSWVYAPGVIPTGTTVVSVAYNGTTTTTAQINTGALTSTTTTIEFWRPDTITSSIIGSYVSSLDTGNTLWTGDFYLEIHNVQQEAFKIPPPPKITAGPSQFTITLPAALLPKDLQEWDLQFAKAPDNFAFGQWFDVGTFPAQTTQDASDTELSGTVGVYQHTPPDTTAPLPFYIYRYRLRANNSQSEWSAIGYAGRVQANSEQHT